MGTTQSAWGAHVWIERFTPTRVGTTMAHALENTTPDWFTPTRVGTTVVTLLDAGEVTGSPPRVWGQHTHARAHNTHTSGSPPRVWGQLATGEQGQLSPVGSPPRVWGQRRGGTRPGPSRLVHPHACGDNHRARSTPCLPCRFTPTRVGTTLPIWPRQEPDRFTPTRVGTTCLGAGLGRLCNGSPPRVWGQPVISSH